MAWSFIAPCVSHTVWSISTERQADCRKRRTTHELCNFSYDPTYLCKNYTCEQNDASTKEPTTFSSLDERHILYFLFFSLRSANTPLVMESQLQRTSIVVSKDGCSKPSADEYEQYKLQTRGEYEDLMIEFEFRCRRAAMMNYHESSRYDLKVYYMELVAALLGAVSMTSIGAYLMQNQDDLSLSNFTKHGGLGAVGLVGVVGAFLIELMSKGSSRMIPSLSRRAEAHVTSGASWQALAQRTRSYRIQLDNPHLDVPVYAEWYNDLITQRHKLCSAVCIPESTYRKYNDPTTVFQLLKRRKHLFLQFLELQKMDADDFLSRKASLEARHKKD